MEFLDDVVIISGTPPPRKRDRVIWKMRPPRPGHARPVPRTQRRGRGSTRQDAARGRRERPPDNLLTAKLSACRESQMLATVDLGHAYHHASITMTPLEPDNRRGRCNHQRDLGDRPGQRDHKLGQGHYRSGARQSARAARRKEMACWGCGGQHKLSACPSITCYIHEGTDMGVVESSRRGPNSGGGEGDTT